MTSIVILKYYHPYLKQITFQYLLLNRHVIVELFNMFLYNFYIQRQRFRNILESCVHTENKFLFFLCYATFCPIFVFIMTWTRNG